MFVKFGTQKLECASSQFLIPCFQCICNNYMLGFSRLWFPILCHFFPPKPLSSIGPKGSIPGPPTNVDFCRQSNLQREGGHVCNWSLSHIQEVFDALQLCAQHFS